MFLVVRVLYHKIFLAHTRQDTGSITQQHLAHTLHSVTAYRESKPQAHSGRALVFTELTQTSALKNTVHRGVSVPGYQQESVKPVASSGVGWLVKQETCAMPQKSKCLVAVKTN